MTDRDFLTEEELDALLPSPPIFNVGAVKERVLTQISPVEQPSAQKPSRHLWKGLLLAAAVCVLSVSCLAVADYASGGRIAAALGIVPVAKEEESASAVGQSAELVPNKPVSVNPVKAEPEPESEPELPELGAELTNSFSFTPAQTQLLRPAAQTVNKTAVNQNVTMTVLQTLGDSQYLYIAVRFDFPEGVPVDTTYRFSDMDFLVDGQQGNSWNSTVTECTTHSVTYLISARSFEALSGQTVTLRYSDYGFYKPEEQDATTLTLPSGKVTIVQISADGNIVFNNTDATVTIGDKTTVQVGDTSVVLGGGNEESAPAGENVSSEAPAAQAAPTNVPTRTETDEARGIITYYYADGSVLVTCDGTHGEQYLVVADEGTSSFRIIDDPSGHPGFNTLLPGKWEQSWTLSYQDLSKSWTGKESLFVPGYNLAALRISPLSCHLEFSGQLDLNDPDANIPYVPDMAVTFIMTDGSTPEQAIHLSGRSAHTEEDGSYISVSEQRFKTPIDPSKISAVVIDGKTFPLT
ncbi:MAG: hypothetical protein LKJ86_02100 [Oscillibacter sp.]|jgi:hypothetical protein|nr:hypothetical protein [Oscillibacter sp.]